MKLFLDASVLLAACGRPAGGSHAVCDLAAGQGWRLLASDSVMREVEKNVRLRLPAATADVLLTLDRADFGGVMGVGFYGLAVMKPGDFLRRERAAGRLV